MIHLPIPLHDVIIGLIILWILIRLSRRPAVVRTQVVTDESSDESSSDGYCGKCGKLLRAGGVADDMPYCTECGHHRRCGACLHPLP